MKAISLTRRINLNKNLVPTIGSVRNLNVHEYVSMEVMRNFNIPVPKGGMAQKPEDAVKVYKDIIGEF